MWYLGQLVVFPENMVVPNSSEMMLSKRDWKLGDRAIVLSFATPPPQLPYCDPSHPLWPPQKTAISNQLVYTAGQIGYYPWSFDCKAFVATFISDKCPLSHLSLFCHNMIRTEHSIGILWDGESQCDCK